MFFLALIPPLWRRVMDPKVTDLRAQSQLSTALDPDEIQSLMPELPVEAPAVTLAGEPA
jgi:hypothetical protein